MRSQCAIVLALPLAMACESANVSHTSLPSDAPDLSLRGVAFARLADGRVVARGTAEHLDYRRAGGRLVAFASAASIEPQGGTGLASFGTLYFAAPLVDGEIANRHGNAWGGLHLGPARGDRPLTEAVGDDRAV